MVDLQKPFPVASLFWNSGKQSCQERSKERGRRLEWQFSLSESHTSYFYPISLAKASHVVYLNSKG
jgi:hypothetical protein